MIFSKITLKLLNHSKWNCGHGICCYDKHDNSFVEIWLPWKKNNNLSLKFKKCWKFAQIIYKVDVCGGYWIFQFEFGYLNIHLFIQLSKPNVDSIFLHWNVCIFNQSNRIVLLWKQRERERKKKELEKQTITVHIAQMHQWVENCSLIFLFYVAKFRLWTNFDVWNINNSENSDKYTNTILIKFENYPK